MYFENKIIEKARNILLGRLKKSTISLSSNELVQEYLVQKLILEEREIFGALWLDMKNRLIAIEDIALGAISNAIVFPREVVKSALKYNAASVIIYHNHPGGDAIFSPADKKLTSDMRKILKLIDVHLLDHIVVAGTTARSLSSSGWIGTVDG